jgi:hypothetical protein
MPRTKDVHVALFPFTKNLLKRFSEESGHTQSDLIRSLLYLYFNERIDPQSVDLTEDEKAFLFFEHVVEQL